MSRYRVYYTQTIGEEVFRGYHYSTSGYKDIEARDKKHAFMKFQNEMLKFGVENFKTFKITDIQDVVDVFALSSSYYDYFSDNTWEYHAADSTRISINSTTAADIAVSNAIYYQTYAYTANSWTTNA